MGDQGEVETGVAITRVATAQAYLSGNTALWTPAAGKRFRLKRLMATIPGDAYAGAPGPVTLSFQDGTTPIGIAFQFYLPAAAPNVAGCLLVTPWLDLGDGYLSAAIGNALNANLSLTIAGAGAAQIIVAGVEE